MAAGYLRLFVRLFVQSSCEVALELLVLVTSITPLSRFASYAR